MDPTVEHEDMGGENGMDSLVSELANAIPGIDEAMSFAEMLKWDSSSLLFVSLLHVLTLL